MRFCHPVFLPLPLSSLPLRKCPKPYDLFAEKANLANAARASRDESRRRRRIFAMARINGGEMLVRALEREGVHDVFALHGGHLDAIFGACREHNFRVIDTR